jgi:hypothetical protein
MEVGDKKEREKLSGRQKGERGAELDQERKHVTTTEQEKRGKAQGKGIRV